MSRFPPDDLWRLWISVKVSLSLLSPLDWQPGRGFHCPCQKLVSISCNTFGFASVSLVPPNQKNALQHRGSVCFRKLLSLMRLDIISFHPPVKLSRNTQNNEWVNDHRWWLICHFQFYSLLSVLKSTQKQNIVVSLPYMLQYGYRVK